MYVIVSNNYKDEYNYTSNLVTYGLIITEITC